MVLSGRDALILDMQSAVELMRLLDAENAALYNRFRSSEATTSYYTAGYGVVQDIRRAVREWNNTEEE